MLITRNGSATGCAARRSIASSITGGGSEGAPTSLSLPTDRPRPAVQTYRERSLALHLPADLSAAVNALAKREGLTPFMVLLAALQFVLARFSGKAGCGRWNLGCGPPACSSGRTDRVFVNMLPARGPFGRSDGARLSGATKETALGAYAHQDLPFEKLVAELQPARDLSRQPIVQSLFVLQNTPRESGLNLAGLKLTAEGSNKATSTKSVSLYGTSTSKFDVSLYLTPGDDGFEGFWEYATDLFDASSIEDISRNYVES
ncbi:MAG: condensation domain-containing protein [Parvularculaceae bacterium]